MYSIFFLYLQNVIFIFPTSKIKQTQTHTGNPAYKTTYSKHVWRLTVYLTIDYDSKWKKIEYEAMMIDTTVDLPSLYIFWYETNDLKVLV